MEMEKPLKVDGASELANAIVFQAAEDFTRSYKKFLVTGGEKEKTKMEEDEKFFHSFWFRELTNLNGEYLVEGIRCKVRESLDKIEE